jgi:hypothetical protein
MQDQRLLALSRCVLSPRRRSNDHCEQFDHCDSNHQHRDCYRIVIEPMPLLYIRGTPPCSSNSTTYAQMCRTLSPWVYAISPYRVARRAQRCAGGREPRERRIGPSGSAQVTARRFDRERRPPDFAGVGSPEIGRQSAMPIRARTEEPAFAVSPTVIDRHKIRSRGSEGDARARTGGSSRRGRRLPEPWR